MISVHFLYSHKYLSEVPPRGMQDQAEGRILNQTMYYAKSRIESNGVGDRTLVVLVSRILCGLFDEIAHDLFQKLADAGLLFTSKL